MLGREKWNWSTDLKRDLLVRKPESAQAGSLGEWINEKSIILLVGKAAQ